MIWEKPKLSEPILVNHMQTNQHYTELIMGQFHEAKVQRKTQPGGISLNFK